MNPKLYHKFIEMYDDVIDAKDLSSAVNESTGNFYTLNEVTTELK